MVNERGATIMPLRDHFRPPLDHKHSWDELHGGWPMTIVQRLFPILPEGYVAAPTVHLGPSFEIDVSTFEQDEPSAVSGATPGGTATCAIPSPTLTLEAEVAEQDEYEVRVYDSRRGRMLVAAIEIVSPANKDRPEHRRAFVAKCAALLQKNVCVSIVDIVTVRQFNLYADLLDLIGKEDPALRADGADPPYLYAVTLRGRKQPRKRPLLDAWFYPLALGQSLPPLPLWLDIDLAISLDLEASYEDACRVLRIS
jgi:hypothetical protein